MDKALKVLDTLENVDNGVNAEYYSVAADYYKVRLVHLIIQFQAIDLLVGKGRICSILQELTALSRMR